MPLDATLIRGKLFQGSAPPLGSDLCWAGFDAVVLAAREFQPESWKIPGVRVIRVPLDDINVPLTFNELRDVRLAAQTIAAMLHHGKKVLVTCWLGLNRSGLIVAETLCRYWGMSPIQAIHLVRSKRGPSALSNSSFVHAIVTDCKREVRACAG